MFGGEELLMSSNLLNTTHHDAAANWRVGTNVSTNTFLDTNKYFIHLCENSLSTGAARENQIKISETEPNLRDLWSFCSEIYPMFCRFEGTSDAPIPRKQIRSQNLQDLEPGHDDGIWTLECVFPLCATRGRRANQVCPSLDLEDLR